MSVWWEITSACVGGMSTLALALLCLYGALSLFRREPAASAPDTSSKRGEDSTRRTRPAKAQSSWDEFEERRAEKRRRLHSGPEEDEDEAETNPWEKALQPDSVRPPADVRPPSGVVWTPRSRRRGTE